MSAFEPLEHNDSRLFYIEQLRKNNQFNQKANNLISKLNFLPIETFKQDSSLYFQGKDLKQKFYSSGTSLQKSQSLFSQSGIDLYEFESVFTFKSMLDSFYGSSSLDVKGYSFIPSLTLMPTSSLSWMIHSLAKYWSVENISINDFITKVDHSKKYWLFTTTIQLVDLFDLLKKQKLKLHLGSQVALIHTGGSKGIRREELKKSQIHSYCHKLLNLSSDNIISEYSMSELATQAYDWICYNNRISNLSQKTFTPDNQRSFRFPSWVKLTVDSQADLDTPPQSQGRGALVVFDPFRIDYSYPIRTQDICELKTKVDTHRGSFFNFIERIPSSSLKGCSLSIKPLIKDPLSNISIDNSSYLNISLKDIKKRSTAASNFLSSYLSSNITQNIYSSYFGSQKSSHLILDSIRQSLNISKDLYSQALKSLGLSQNDKRTHINSFIPSSVLMLFSSTNEMALIYPVIFAYICGFEVYAKLSSKSDNPISLHFLNSFNSYIEQNHFEKTKINVLDNSTFYQTKLKVGFILVHGSWETINILKQRFPNSIKAFGPSLTFNIDSSYNNIDQILTDAFLLRQNGCLSSKGLILLNSKLKKKDLIDHLPQDLSWLTPDSKYCHSIKNAQIDLLQRSIFFKKRTYPNEPLFPIYEPSSIDQINPSMLPKYPFCLPIFLIRKDFDPEQFQLYLSSLKSKFQDLSLILSSKSILDLLPLDKIKEQHPFIEFRSHGCANIYPWNGSFQNNSLWLLTSDPKK